MTPTATWLASAGAVLALTLAACGDSPVETPAVDDDDEAHDLSDEWIEAYAAHEAGKFDSASCSGATFVDDEGNNYGGRVALSFDDGPHDWRTDQVLEVLGRYGISATFFVQGSNIRDAGDIEVMRRVLAAGHTLANHAVTHRHMSQLPTATILDEMHTVNAHIREAGATPQYFRFPFGDASCNDLRTIENAGMTWVGWTVDTGDWCYASEGNGGVGVCTWGGLPTDHTHNMIANTMQQLADYNGGMVLMHDIHWYTVSQLDELIRTIQYAGYTFTTIDDVSTFPRLNTGVSTPATGTGLPAGMCEVTAAGARAWSSPDWVEAGFSLDASTRVALIEATPTNGFYHVRDGAGRTFWLWGESVRCNGESMGTATPSTGSCTVTSSWGAWAASAPSYTAPTYGDAPLAQWSQHPWLDRELHNGTFYRIDPGLHGVSEAYVSRNTVSCE